jgi:hypothetical protein
MIYIVKAIKGTRTSKRTGDGSFDIRLAVIPDSQKDAISRTEAISN